MKVSIAVATYNGEKYLKEQLDSFLNQTRLPDEVILSDDRSNDGTVAIINEFIRNAPFDVKLLENKINLGYSKNFQQAILEATGDLIFLSDQDDVWFEEKIERIVEIAKDNPATDLIVNDTEIVQSDLSPTGITKMDKISAVGNNMRSMVMGTCTAVRREFVRLCMPMPENFKGHDTWLHTIADILDSRLVIEEVLQYYRIHGKNTSTNILNKTKKLNYLDLLFSYLNSSDEIRDDLKIQINNKRLLCDWLDTQKDMILDENKTELIGTLKSEIAAMKERLQIYNLNKFKRIIPITCMLVKGNYSHFKGWKSVFKDIIA